MDKLIFKRIEKGFKKGYYYLGIDKNFPRVYISFYYDGDNFRKYVNSKCWIAYPASKLRIYTLIS